MRGVIWRLLPTVRGQFVGEERNAPEKTVSFFCIRQDNGQVLWSGVRLPEPWWIGIEAVHEGVALLHEFAVPDFPDHKKIHALDLSTGTLLWSDQDAKFLFADGGSIYALSGPDDGRYIAIDIRSGARTRELEAEEVRNLRRHAHSHTPEPVEFPAPFDYRGEGESPLRARIDGLLRDTRRLRFIEYIEKKGILALGYYTSVSDDLPDPPMDHHFIIADAGSETLYRDLLNERTSAAVPDTFFAIGDMLFTIAGKKVLKAFDLSRTDG